MRSAITRDLTRQDTRRWILNAWYPRLTEAMLPPRRQSSGARAPVGRIHRTPRWSRRALNAPRETSLRVHGIGDSQRAVESGCLTDQVQGLTSAGAMTSEDQVGPAGTETFPVRKSSAAWASFSASSRGWDFQGPQEQPPAPTERLIK